MDGCNINVTSPSIMGTYRKRRVRGRSDVQ
jgi:hypothetical protein